MKIVAAAAVVLAVAASASGAVSRTGLRGKLLIEPAFPVCHVNEPCTKPAGNTRLVFMRGGLARTTRTAEDGTYRITLAPGSYTVSAPGPGRVRRLSPARVVVPREGYRRLIFKLDIGIR